MQRHGCGKVWAKCKVDGVTTVEDFASLPGLLGKGRFSDLRDYLVKAGIIAEADVKALKNLYTAWKACGAKDACVDDKVSLFAERASAAGLPKVFRPSKSVFKAFMKSPDTFYEPLRKFVSAVENYDAVKVPDPEDITTVTSRLQLVATMVSFSYEDCPRDFLHLHTDQMSQLFIEHVDATIVRDLDIRIRKLIFDAVTKEAKKTGEGQILGKFWKPAVEELYGLTGEATKLIARRSLAAGFTRAGAKQSYDLRRDYSIPRSHRSRSRSYRRVRSCTRSRSRDTEHRRTVEEEERMLDLEDNCVSDDSRD